LVAKGLRSLRVYKQPVASLIHGDILTVAFFANRSFNNIVICLVIINKYFTSKQKEVKIIVIPVYQMFQRLMFNET